jgi:hypothetical protein
VSEPSYDRFTLMPLRRSDDSPVFTDEELDRLQEQHRT